MAKGIALRNWWLHEGDYETDDQFNAAVELELARFQHIGERFGIALIATPVKKREVLKDGRVIYWTQAWHFQTATVPAVSGSEPEVWPEPIPDETIEAVEEAAESLEEAA
jgi:hypothetical protein